MRIFVAGATGVIGRSLVPQLVAAGHEVVGSTRNPASAARQPGIDLVAMNGLDASSVSRAVADARPDVVIHQLSALAASGSNLRRFDQEFAVTNELRTRGTDLLLAAAVAAGAKRFIAQSYTGWPNARTGGPVKDERDPLDPQPTTASRKTHAAIRYVEEAVTSAPDLDGLVLRYGTFYGPGTSFDRDGEITEAIRRRKLPLVGSGAGIWSFVHIDDAARATVDAVEHGGPGVYNVVDDDPSPVSTWLPVLSELLGAKPPRRVPVWVARLLIGEHGVAMMTEMRGSANERAKRELCWQPAYPSWWKGFEATLG
jgi:nucleoside-diphosphate-sugar epimerase